MKKTTYLFILLAAIMLTVTYGFKKTRVHSTPPPQEVGANVITGTGIGQKAPDIKLESPNGEIIALSSLKGKMVLIDFWASWCRPCRFENPTIVNAYQNYKNKEFKNGAGFTVYSVSLDKYKESWLDAIENDQLEWETHVSDLLGWKSKAAAIYGVRGIPSSFLIDGNGIIVAKGNSLRGQGLTNTLQLQLSEN